MTIKAMSKGDLYKKLNGLSRDEVANEIYEVVMKNRLIDEQAAKKIHRLRKNEVREVLTNLGELD